MVETQMLVTQEETFGPVAAIMPFDAEDEVIDRANDTVCGLAAYDFTRDVRREGGHHGIEEYLDVKYVSPGGVTRV